MVLARAAHLVPVLQAEGGVIRRQVKICERPSVREHPLEVAVIYPDHVGENRLYTHPMREDERYRSSDHPSSEAQPLLQSLADIFGQDYVPAMADDGVVLRPVAAGFVVRMLPATGYMVAREQISRS
jgi:hypothetical protein